MQAQSKHAGNRWPKFFAILCILLISLSLLLVLEPLDRSLSEFLRTHSYPSFASFMEQSLFEGKSFGGGDIATFLQIGVLLLWGGSYSDLAPELLVRWRSLLGYILISSILTGLWVHLFKGLVARPRPYELGLGGTLSSSWAGWPKGALHGWGHGSFPSGHTANVMTMMGFSYGLHALGHRRLAYGLGILVLILVGIMATSRVMIGAHWPTDTLAAASMGWSMAHWRYRCWQKQSSSRKGENER